MKENIAAATLICCLLGIAGIGVYYAYLITIPLGVVCTLAVIAMGAYLYIIG